MTLERNLSVLRRRFPDVARAVESVNGVHVEAVRSRSGDVVATVPSAGKPVLLNSRYDPRREARRIAGALSGTAILVGIDSGFLVRAILDGGARRVLIVDPEPEVFRGIASAVDLSDLLNDRRVDLSVGRYGVEGWLSRRYLPVLHGDAVVISPQPRLSRSSGSVAATKELVARALSSIADDYATQARFGRQWTRNIIHGLVRGAGGSQDLPAGRRAAVVAAGPSLDEAIPLLDGFDLVVAVDTALPALVRRGMAPDYVVAIDPQVIGYHHVLPGVPSGTRFAVDLGVPVFSGVRPLFFAGGHPLSRLLSALGAGLPEWDTSGGSVTQSALDLCRLLGVEEARLFGADFSYDAGRAYARGTYVYDVFRSRESRFAPAHSQEAEFVFSRSTLRDGVYRSSLLDSYAQRLDCWLGANGVKSVEGSVLRFSSGRRLPSRYSLSRETVRSVLDRYRRLLASADIEALGEPADLSRLPREGAAVIGTILPLAAALGRESGGAEHVHALLGRAKAVTLEVVAGAQGLLRDL